MQSVLTIRTYKINAAGDSYAASETRTLPGDMGEPFVLNRSAWPACTCPRCS